MSALVELKRYASPVEADVARMALEAQGVGAVLMDDGIGNVFGGVIGTRLMVLEEDRDEAIRILTNPAGDGPDRGYSPPR